MVLGWNLWPSAFYTDPDLNACHCFLSFSLLFSLLLCCRHPPPPTPCVNAHTCAYAHTCMCHVHRTTLGSWISFHHAGSRNLAQVLCLGDKLSHLQSHLACPVPSGCSCYLKGILKSGGEGQHFRDWLWVCNWLFFGCVALGWVLSSYFSFLRSKGTGKHPRAPNLL